MLNCQELITSARDYLNDPNSTLLSDASLLRHINTFQQELWAQARMSNEDFSTIVSVQSLLPLAYANFVQIYSGDAKIHRALIDGIQVSNIAKVYRTDTNPIRRIPHVSESDGVPEYNRDPDADSNMEQDLAYSLVGNYLILHGVLPAGITISLSYEKSPADMFVGLVDAIGTAGTPVYTTVDFTYAENPVTGRMVNDVNYYLGSRFQMTSQTEKHKTFLVIGGTVDSDSLTLHVDDPSTTLTNGDQVAWISGLPAEFHQVLAVGGAYRAAMARQNMKLSQILGQEKLRLQQLAVSMFEQRRTDTSRNVIETGTGAAP